MNKIYTAFSKIMYEVDLCRNRIKPNLNHRLNFFPLNVLDKIIFATPNTKKKKIIYPLFNQNVIKFHWNLTYIRRERK